MNGRNQNEDPEKAYTHNCVLTVKTVPSMVLLRPYESVVLGCDGYGIGEVLGRYPAREDCIIPSTWVRAHS